MLNLGSIIEYRKINGCAGVIETFIGFHKIDLEISKYNASEIINL